MTGKGPDAVEGRRRVPTNVVVAAAVALATFVGAQAFLGGRPQEPSGSVAAARPGSEDGVPVADHRWDEGWERTVESLAPVDLLTVPGQEVPPAPKQEGDASASAGSAPAKDVPRTATVVKPTLPGRGDPTTAAARSERAGASRSSRPSSPPAAQAAVVACRDGEVMGLRRQDGGGIYICAGGAPVGLSNWNLVGGPRTTDRGVTAADLAGMRRYPEDGTLVSVLVDPASGSPEKQYYVFAGGAPIGVTPGFRSSALGARPDVLIGRSAIERADGAGAWSHVRRYPAEGTLLRAGSRHYRVGRDGVVTTTSRRTGATRVDPAAITNRGGPAPWDHLR
jgi:hypothetical protein